MLMALKQPPPSRFSNTDSNGLWEYSPYLSGVGLVEALGLAYSFSFAMWDQIPEPTCIIHLHNMLVQKGYITQKGGLYAAIIATFPTMFFVGGKVPTSDFSGAFSSACGMGISNRAFSQREAIRRNVARTSKNFYEYLDLRANRMFNRTSFLRLCYDADWIPERIPDEEILERSMLALLRMCRSKTILEPAAGEVATERTPLIDHARAEGVTDQMLLIVSNYVEMCRIRAAGPVPDGLDRPELSHDISTIMPAYTQSGGGKSNGMPNDLDLLEMLKADIFNDVCGKHPFSALNYIWVTARMMFQFIKIEGHLERVRNPLHVRAYEQDPWMAHQKRVSLVGLVLAEQDEECMEIMANAFQEEPANPEDHLYWDLHLNEPELGTSDQNRKVNDENDATCMVM
jgi:hypothetical protein